MEKKLSKRVYPTISSQLSLTSLVSPNGEKIVTPREYNELIRLLTNKKKIIEEIEYECNANKEVIPVIKLRKILAHAD
jgi:hypothetical protein